MLEYDADYFGLVPNSPSSAATNTRLIHDAYASGRVFKFSPEVYHFDGYINLPERSKVVGFGGVGAPVPSGLPNGTRFEIDANGYNGEALKFLKGNRFCLYAGISNVCISAKGGTHSDVLKIEQPVAFKACSVRIVADGISTNGVVTQKLNYYDSSWDNEFEDVKVRLSDNSTGYTFKSDMSDSTITEGNYTGGRGIVLSGTGGVRLSNARIDRSNRDNITIRCERDTVNSHIVSNCQLELANRHDILVDADILSGYSRRFAFVISNNTFRSPSLSSNIRLKRGGWFGGVNGGQISGNGSSKTAVIQKPLLWSLDLNTP